MLSRSNLRPFDKNNFFTFSSIEKLSKRVLASHDISLTITLLNFIRILLSFLANTMSAEVVSRLQLDADLCLVMFSTTPMTSSDESFAMVGTPWIHKTVLLEIFDALFELTIFWSRAAICFCRLSTIADILS